MRTCLAVPLASLGMLVPAAAQEAPPLRLPSPEEIAADAPSVTDDDLLVVLVAPEAADALVATAETAGYALERRDPLAPLALDLLSFTTPEGTTPPEAIREVEALEPRATAGVDHRYALQQGDARRYAGAFVGWPAAGCPSRMGVGILDGPVDAAALPGVALEALDVRSAPASEDTWHGTAVAELIAGPGRLEDARIRHAVVADAGGAGVRDVVRGLSWTLEGGADVINVSIAGPYNKILDRGFAAATARGVRIVAAAGNDGPDAPPRYPAAFDDVIAVTAVDAEGAIMPDAVRGSHLDLSAPGVEVWVEAGGGRYATGTSFAAPFVTAALAAGTELDTSDAGAPGRDPIFGDGVLRIRGCPSS